MKRFHRRQFLYLAAGLGGAALGGATAWLAAQAQRQVERGTLQLQVLRLQAEVVAAKIDRFFGDIESQIGWTTQLPWSEAVARGMYYGPVYFRRESEPYMTLAIAGVRRDYGVVVGEVNLRFIWGVVSEMKVGERGIGYMVDAEGRLIAHPDISLVLRNTDMSKFTQVIAARAAAAGSPQEPVQAATDVRGRPVLTGYAPVARLGWLVFAELPIEETSVLAR